ncbi:MAG: hypothetical protein P1V20_26375 [Verrucomicrobiales bacterium]|nr:hypothetical protein [Verrucomicrobiales bacterium]
MSDEKPETETDEPNSAEEVENKDSVAELSPEEQMALYEESLKNDDWGHQPC